MEEEIETYNKTLDDICDQLKLAISMAEDNDLINEFLLSDLKEALETVKNCKSDNMYGS